MSEPLLLQARPSVLARIPRHGHVVVEASAGTGKTYTLEHLVVDLLLSRTATVEKMLVVTFTEKATEELRERVRRKLRDLGEGTDGAAEAGWELDDDDRRLLRGAAAGFDAASISTIHGFCQRVLTEHAFAHRRLFEQRLVDGQETFSRAFRTVVTRELGVRGALREGLLDYLRAGNQNLDELEGVVWEAARKRGAITPAWDPAALLAAARALSDACDVRRLGAALRAVRMAAGKATASFDELRDMLPGLLAGGDAAEVSRMLLVWGKEKVKAAGAQGERDTRWAFLERGLRQLCAGGDAVAARAADAMQAMTTLAAPSVAVLVTELRRRVLALLAEQKRALGLYDFDDMLLFVRDALSGPEADPALVAALRERWDVALIDEFQDTDEVQWAIFRTLFFAGDGGRRLFLIGDPKQAIYGFRNADVHTYLAARDQVHAAGGEVVPLGENHRSTPELIAACNAIFGDGFFTGRLASFMPVTPGPRRLAMVDSAGATLPPVTVVRLTGEGGRGDAVLKRAGYAAFVGAEIRRLVESGVRFGDAGAETPISWHDVMVLTRTNGEAKEIADELRSQGIPHVLYGQEQLMKTAQAEHVQRVLAAIAGPADAEARLKAFLTPFFAVALADLEACRELPETHPLVARLLAWSELAEQRRWPLLFRAMLRDSGLVRRLLALRHGERELTDYQHVFDLLLEEAHRSPATADELARRLRSWIGDNGLPPGVEATVQRLEPETDAVQVLTMHKAKGLEAAVVFVVELRGSKGDGSCPLRVYHLGDERRVHVGDAMGAIATAIEEEDRQEAERLHYVALTRARGLLYLPDAKTQRGNYHWREVEDRLNELLDAHRPGFVVREERCTTPAFLADEPLAWRPDAGLLVEPPSPARELGELRRRRVGRVLTSYTRIRHGAAAADDDPLVEEAAPSQMAPAVELAADDLPGGRGTGILLHRLLEELDPATLRAAGDREAWLAQPSVRELAVRLAAEQGMAAEVVAPACRLAWTALRTPLDEAGLRLPLGLCAAERRSVEMELLFPIPEEAHPRLGERAGGDDPLAFRAGRGFVQGVVDLVFEHEGRTYFVDWKTDRLASYTRHAVEQHVAESYALQAQLYALGVVRLLELRDADDHARRFGGFLYCFLRGMGADRGLVFHRPSWDELRRWEDELRARRDWGAW